MEDIVLLRQLGGVLDRAAGKREQIRDLLIHGLLKVRNKDRRLVKLAPNRAQREYARSCGKRNIVLKARQMGMTTYVAARFFMQTITQPGTLTVQVAHSQDSAEEIFTIVRRFWENLPTKLRQGALVTSRANIRQLVFPRLDSEYRVATAADPNAGRGMTIHHLHCSEVARWPRDGEEVRWSDAGWGPGNSRNLVGRFGTETFTLPRLSRVQTVFLRPYDASTPPRYSRYSATLHVDYPL